jgi:hypothetical protein
MRRTAGRREARAGWFASACAGTGLVLLLWQALSVSLEEPESSSAHAGGRVRGTAHATSPRLVQAGVVVSALGAPSPRAWRPGREAEPDPAPVSSARTREATPSLDLAALLPLTSEERAADGLPVTGMRCTREGAGFSCGSCRTDGDCPVGQGCVANRDTRQFECQASECEEDAHCFPGTVCRAVTTGATGRVVRRCAAEGLRAEGEPCDALPVSPMGSCREGLRCVDQLCTAPCSLDAPASCGEGAVCRQGLDGPGCFPDCLQRGCAEGQRCTSVREGEHQCLLAVQGDCRQTPCAQGERCNLRMSRGRATFWCARVCDSALPDTCGAGSVCGMGSDTASTCFQACDPLEPTACAPGWSCSTVTEDMSVFGCTPDLSP